MLTLLAILITLGAVLLSHEYGHYRVAVACGVKVQRLSLGFGPVLLRWKPKRQRPGQDTEFTIALVPLGGYVKMLDEREGPVDIRELNHAYNRMPVGKRAAIVAAGPLMNLLLAFVLYATVNVLGVHESAPILSTPVPSSLAAQAGVTGGERVVSVAVGGASTELATFEQLRWALTDAVLRGEDARLTLRSGGQQRTLVLPVSKLAHADVSVATFREIGILAPRSPAVVSDLSPSGAGARAGLQDGDVVLAVDGQQVADAQHLRELLRASAPSGRPVRQVWSVQRNGGVISVPVTPQPAVVDGVTVGRIDAAVGTAGERVTVRMGPVQAAQAAARQVWSLTTSSLHLIEGMLVGRSSSKNLSGPLTIGELAGQTAGAGLVEFLSFLALINASLGVMNLLPLPVLDGGHLVLFGFEALTGRAVSAVWDRVLGYTGAAVLGGVMLLAIYNDVVRLVG